MIVNLTQGMRFGVGVDGLTEAARGEAVKFDGVIDPPGGQLVDPHVELIESQQALMESLNISVGAAARYGMASVDAKMELAQSRAVNAHSVYLLLHVAVTNPAQYMDNPRISRPAKDAYLRDPDEFRSIYGDYFIDEIYGGGEFFGLFVFETRDERSQTDLSVNAHLSLGNFLAGADITASFKDTIQQFSQKSSMSITAVMDGGSGLQNPSNMDELLDLYRGFNAAVRNHPVSYRAGLKEFRYLPLPAGSSWVEQAVRRSTIEACGNYVIDALSTRSTVDFILRYPQQFQPYDSNALREYLTQLNDRIPKLARRATACSNDVRECAIAPDEQPPAAFPLPARLDIADPIEAKWDWILHHDDFARPYFGPQFLAGRTFQDDWQPGPANEDAPNGGRYFIFHDGEKPTAGLVERYAYDYDATGTDRETGEAYEIHRHYDAMVYAVYGPIFTEYWRMNGPNGPHGYPLGDEQFGTQGPLAAPALIGWRYQLFNDRGMPAAHPDASNFHHGSMGLWYHVDNPDAVLDWPPDE